MLGNVYSLGKKGGKIEYFLHTMDNL